MVAHVNAANRFHETALMIACQKQNIDAINILLHAGANHHISDSDGGTLLHYAVRGDFNKKGTSICCGRCYGILVCVCV